MTRLQREVADLKSGGEAVEERARSELGLVKPGETFYRVIDHAAVQSAPPRAAEPALAPAPVATPEKLPVAQLERAANNGCTGACRCRRR